MKLAKILIIESLFIVAAILAYVLFYRQPASQKTSDALKTIADCPGCNVVVILVDTLRADHLPAYGYKRDTAPFLTSFLNKSTVFEKAFSASCWTAPATSSVFTSLYPSQHGVISGFLATKKMIKDGLPIHMNKIPQKDITLGEMMLEAGYNTLAVADNINIGKEMGFDRGFSQFEKFNEKGADKVNHSASGFIDKVKDKGPYFAYLHYMDPHAPYLQINPFYSKCLKETDMSEKQKMICAYDSEIYNLDVNLKRMFDKYGWLENSIIFFLADHGEEFWDHGQRGHGKTLYTELIHVPFAVYHPRWQGRQISYNVHTIDLLPTLAALIGYDIRPQWKGENLLPFLNGTMPYKDRILFSERLRTPFSKSKWWKRSVLDKNLHYIHTEDNVKILNQELYDLKNDFSEKSNLSEKSKDDVQNSLKLLSVLPDAKEVQQNSGKGQDDVKIEVDQELVDQLKSLGYID